MRANIPRRRPPHPQPLSSQQVGAGAGSQQVGAGSQQEGAGSQQLVVETLEQEEILEQETLPLNDFLSNMNQDNAVINESVPGIFRGREMPRNSTFFVQINEKNEDIPNKNATFCHFYLRSKLRLGESN